MRSIQATIIEGSGTAPKKIELDSRINLRLSGESGTLYSWDVMSSPKTSKAQLSGQINSEAQYGPLDTYGVYLIRLYVDRNMPTEKVYYTALGVPETNTGIQAAEPAFSITGHVKNGDFELPGPLAGWAAFWTITDNENILATGGGSSRGRIAPNNFTPASGLHAMCLGDDENAVQSFAQGSTFSVSQVVNFDGMSRLKLKLKFGK